MGYSLAVLATSTETQQKMLAFLDEHYKDWYVVSGRKGMLGVSYPTASLDYIRSKDVLGFNYSGASGFEREFMMTVLRWAALKVGKTKTFNKVESFPYLDAEESKWPVIVVSSAEEYAAIRKKDQWAACTSHGVRWDVPSNSLSLMMDPNIDISIEQMNKIREDVGPPPKDGVAFREWDRKRAHLFYEADKDSFEAGMDIIRAEISRLDTLWGAL